MSFTNIPAFPHHSPISSSNNSSDDESTAFRNPNSTGTPRSQLKNPGALQAAYLSPSTPMIMSRQMSSPSPSISSQQGQSSSSSMPVASPGGSISYPPHHPLYQSKHSCSICGDRASGKHYGVYSCEGCKGFFKRTVRKDLTYACREDRNCIVDKRQRNRCQFCRYQKCLQMGMRREAVQEERMRSKEKRQRQQGLAGGASGGNASGSDSDLESGAPQSIPPTPGPRGVGHLASGGSDFNLDKLLAADNLILGGFLSNAGQIRTLDLGSLLHHQPDNNRQLVEICEKELHMAVQYIRMCPFIGELPLADQIALVKCAWNELHLSAMGARSMFANTNSGLVLSSGLCITPQHSSLFGLSGLVERMAGELIAKMSELQVDQFELSCLRGIILFNPDAKGLLNVDRVESCRERLYSALEDHCAQSHPADVSRFAKLLLRLPSLRSIGLKCLDLLFFSQLFPNLPFDGFLIRLLTQPNRDLRSVAMEVENDEFQRRLRSPMDGSGSAGASPGLNGGLPNADFFAALAGSNPGSSFNYGNFVKQEPPNSFS